MKGSILRTNQRRYTGIPRIADIGIAIAKASQAGGAGTQDPNGGFIWLSWTGTVMEATAAASLAGISSRIVESAYGLMQSFYGNGLYNSGYAFLPVVAHIMSLSGWVVSAGQHAAGADNSFLFAWTGSFRTSGSYAIFTPLLMRQNTANDYTYVSLSGATADVQIGGFIVSGPGY